MLKRLPSLKDKLETQASEEKVEAKVEKKKK